MKILIRLFFIFLSLITLPILADNLKKDCDTPNLCIKHFMFSQDICSQEHIQSVAPYFHLIPKIYHSKCRQCTKCGSFVRLQEEVIAVPCYKQNPDTKEWIETERLLYAKVYSCSCCKRCYNVDNCQEWGLWDGKEWLFDCDYVPDEWPLCKEKSWSSLYFDKYFNTQFPYFEHFLQYCSENSDCKCHWPEISFLAKTISNRVYSYFKKIIDRQFIDDDYLPHWKNYFSNHGKTISLISHSFFYSQYHQSLINAAKYIDQASITGEGTEALTYIDDCISSIQPMFLMLYDQCLNKHPHSKIYYEKGMVLFHQGEYDKAFENTQDLVGFAEKHGREDLLTSEMYLQEAKAYIQRYSYDDAITALTNAIKKDPFNKDALFERSTAYFEIGMYREALDDFLQTGFKSVPSDPIAAQNLLLSSEGLTIGIIKGSADGAVGLINTVDSLGHGLWAFAKQPITVSKELIEAVSICIECIKNNSTKEILEQIAPELFQLVCEWDQMERKERGELTGYVIGKYGIEILALKNVFKAMSALNDLKKANAMLTLEYMASSTKNANALLETVSKIGAKTKKQFKPFSRSYYRHNLIVETGFDPGKAIQAHHVFPQALESQFAKIGINIHDPKYLTWWEASSHQRIAKAYNSAWKEFWEEHRWAPSQSQIMEYGRQIMQEHGMSVRY